MYAKAVDAVANNATTAVLRKLMTPNEAVKKTVSKKPPSHVVGLSAQRFGFLRSFTQCAVILLSSTQFGRISAVLALLTASCLPPDRRLCCQLLNVVHHEI